MQSTYVRPTKSEIKQVVYKTACEAKTVSEIASDLEMPERQVRDIVKKNKYEIQKRGSQLISEGLDAAVETTINNVRKARDISLKAPDEMSPNEMRFQEKQGLPAVKTILETAGIVGAAGSQSTITQVLHQQNTTILTPAVQTILSNLSNKLIEENEI